MATRKSIRLSGHYVVSINALPFHVRILNSKKLEVRTQSYFILFLELKDHPTRYFNFGLRRFHLNGCRVSLNLILKDKPKTNPSKN